MLELVGNKCMLLTFVSFLYVVLTIISFYSKDKVKLSDTTIYGRLLIITLISLICESDLSLFYNTGYWVREISMKAYLCCCILWFNTLLYYLLTIVYKDTSKMSIGLIVLTLIECLGAIILGVTYAYEDSLLMYSYGPAVNVSFAAGGIDIAIMLLILTFKFNTIKEKRVIPIVFFIVLMVVVVIAQKINPQYLIVNFAFGLVVSLMYHTIENPDIKLVEYEQREKEKVIAAANSKNEFLSNMAHELRTPLNAIVGLSSDIQTFDDRIFVDVKEDSKDLIYASNLLLDIIGNILDASKIESGKLDVVESDYYAKREIEAVAKLYEIKAKDKNLTFVFEMSENIPRALFGDKLRILQILSILLDNAVKFTSVGRVTFTVSWSDVTSNLSIKISDSGSGMSEEQINNIMVDADSLEVDKVYSNQGSGLNLIIAKKLTGILGGRIDIDSKEMAGTVITLAIPQKIGSEERLFELARLERADLADLDVKGKRILVVDDNPLNIKVLRRTIKDYDFDIEEAHNGKDAIEQIELNNNYDVVLMDILMPVMNGEEAMKALKSKPNFNTPVIALTADAASSSSAKYTQMGFDDYIPKPFTKDIVSQKLYKIFSESVGEKK